jgi:hypothetical protein
MTVQLCLLALSVVVDAASAAAAPLVKVRVFEQAL